MQQRFLTIVCSLVLCYTAMSQKIIDVTGEYYLTGVMETASGFKLDKDSSFEFFFSYGALDRTGKGKWKQVGNKIIFYSGAKPAPSIVLAKKEKNEAQGITMHITDNNKQLLPFNYCLLYIGKTPVVQKTNNEGVTHFNETNADSVEVVFEFCPEKRNVFPIQAQYNYYEFRFEPWMMDVDFDNFELTIANNTLTGGHPLLTKKELTYKKLSGQ